MDDNTANLLFCVALFATIAVIAVARAWARRAEAHEQTERTVARLRSNDKDAQ